jgi:hypothetical protein
VAQDDSVEAASVIVKCNGLERIRPLSLQVALHIDLKSSCARVTGVGVNRALELVSVIWGISICCPANTACNNIVVVNPTIVVCSIAIRDNLTLASAAITLLVLQSRTEVASVGASSTVAIGWSVGVKKLKKVSFKRPSVILGIAVCHNLSSVWNGTWPCS